MSTEVAGHRLRETVAEEIRVWLTRRRISGVKLAEEIGRSQAYVSRRLNGATPFDVDDLERIAEVLDVRVVDLLPGDGKGALTTRSYATTRPGMFPMPDHPIIQMSTRIPIQSKRTAPTGR